MTVANIEQPSLLASLLAKEVKDTGSAKASATGDRGFADRLDKVLAADGKTVRLNDTRARELAESLNLQMLQTTLSLSSEQPVSSPAVPVSGRQSASMKALIEAYASNQAAAPAESEPAAAPVQPLPEPERSASRAASAAATTTTLRQEKGSQWLDPIITKASRRYGVDAGLIKAVIKAESGFNPNAVSHAGAQGLMQLMPGTARSLGVTDSFDPEQNVMGGTRFLRDLLNRYNGDLDSALAAYNWGPGNVDKRSGRMPQETRSYLVRVKQLYNSYTA